MKSHTDEKLVAEPSGKFHDLILHISSFEAYAVHAKRSSFIFIQRKVQFLVMSCLLIYWWTDTQCKGCPWLRHKLHNINIHRSVLAVDLCCMSYQSLPMFPVSCLHFQLTNIVCKNIRLSNKIISEITSFEYLYKVTGDTNLKKAHK